MSGQSSSCIASADLRNVSTARQRLRLTLNYQESIPAPEGEIGSDQIRGISITPAGRLLVAHSVSHAARRFCPLVTLLQPRSHSCNTGLHSCNPGHTPATQGYTPATQGYTPATQVTLLQPRLHFCNLEMHSCILLTFFNLSFLRRNPLVTDLMPEHAWKIIILDQASCT